MADGRNLYHPHQTLDEPHWLSSDQPSSTAVTNALVWAIATGIVLGLLNWL